MVGELGHEEPAIAFNVSPMAPHLGRNTPPLDVAGGTGHWIGDCRRACAAKAIREGARKAGSAATQQTSAPATDDSSVERSDELFAELKTDLFAANADG